MIALLCVMLAVARPPVVEGRVGEPAAPVAGAQVTLSQGERTQVVRTGADGVYRFRAFEGPGAVAVILPPGWTLAEQGAKAFESAVPGESVRLDFLARARRVLRGLALLGGVGLAGVDLAAGQTLVAHTNDGGAFLLEGLPPGRVELSVEVLGLSGAVEMPAGPADLARDVVLAAPRLEALRLQAVAQEPARRPLAAWSQGKPLNETEVSAIERLCALANLDPAFRLVIVGPASEQGAAARAALVLRRYLTGPGLVPRERILFAVGEVATGGHLALILMR